jgi:thimet oligopeptidase
MTVRASAFFLAALLTASAVCAQAPAAGASIEAPFYTGVTDAAALRGIVEAHVARADALLNAVLRVTGARTLENTLVPYDRMWSEMASARSLPAIVARLHPEEGMRTAAEKLGQELTAKSSEISLRPDLHAALAALPLAGLVPAARRLVERDVRNGRLAGVDRPEATRARLKQLREQLQVASQDFSRNLLNGQRTIRVSAAELDGLPADFITARKPDAAGMITLTTDDVDVQPVLTYARNTDIRKRLQIERSNVAVPGNIDVLRRMLAIRHEIATTLGFRTWAEYHAQTRMAGSAAAVSEFIDRIVQAARPKAAREYAEQLRRKQLDVPGATSVEPWDRGFYSEQIRRTSYNFDSQEMRPYFAYDRVRTGVMDIAARLFEVTFRPAPQLPTWHADVETYEVLRGGTLIGRIYLDVHPRPQKANSGASASTTRRGAAGRQVPEVVLTASVPGGRAGDPGLMTHEQVRTLFHEFGHVMHALVAGHGPWSGLNGIDLEADAAEAPSTMLEEWIWDARTLATFARHYQTGEPVPAALVERMRRAGEFGKGLDADRQAFLSSLSLTLHNQDPKDLDPASVAPDLLAKRNFVRWVDGTMVAQFTHLANNLYTSAYYTYMWSRVIAKDLFSRFDRADLLAPAVARQYRDTVLVPGGTKPAAELFSDFLGRPFSFAAFQAWLNEETTTSSN